jgi:hypothetical protein
MPIPFIPIAIGTLIGVKGPALVRKVKEYFTTRDVVSVEIPLDANLPIEMKRDVINLLSNIRDPQILEKMASYYRNMGFSISAGLIAQKIEFLRKG